METVTIFADPSGVWNYTHEDRNGVLIANGPLEGYDSYATVLAAVTTEFPAALVAVPPADLQIIVGEPEPVVDQVAEGGVSE